MWLYVYKYNFFSHNYDLIVYITIQIYISHCDNNFQTNSNQLSM